MRDLFQDYTPGARVRELENNAFDIVPNYRFNRDLSEEELVEENRLFSEVSIQIESIREELKRVTEEYKEKLKPLEAKAKKHLLTIKTGQVERVDTVYLIQDFDEGKIGTYTSEGVILGERDMKPAELQASVFRVQHGVTITSSLKTGTEGE